jgi:rubrerythrin
MTDKPSYLGLLCGIANAEGQGYEYYHAWATRTPDLQLRAVLATVALREREHSLAFAKRVDELGFELEDTSDFDLSRQIEIVSSDLTDEEKMEALGFFKERPGYDQERDVFAGMLEDKTIDIQTSALIGRYVGEERDSARMIRDCVVQYKARHDARTSDEEPSRMDRLEHKLDTICASVEALQELVVAKSASNGKRKAQSAISS